MWTEGRASCQSRWTAWVVAIPCGEEQLHFWKPSSIPTERYLQKQVSNHQRTCRRMNSTGFIGSFLSPPINVSIEAGQVHGTHPISAREVGLPSTVRDLSTNACIMARIVVSSLRCAKRFQERQPVAPSTYKHLLQLSTD